MTDEQPPDGYQHQRPRLTRSLRWHARHSKKGSDLRTVLILAAAELDRIDIERALMFMGSLALWDQIRAIIENDAAWEQGEARAALRALIEKGPGR